MSTIDGADYTVHQLRDWLRSLNKPISGNKAELILRLSEVLNNIRGVCPGLMSDANNLPGGLNNSLAGGSNNNLAGGSNEDDAVSSVSNVVDCSSLCENVSREAELLRLQLSLAEKERQLLAKEVEILKKEAALNKVSQPVEVKAELAFTTVKDAITDFNESTNVDQWITHFKSAVKMFGLTDNVAKTLLWCKVKNNAQSWLMAKENYAYMDLDILLSEMREVFKTNTSKLEQRKKFQTRKWQHNETFKKYFDDKMLLSNCLNVEEAELLEHLIAGITNIQLRNQAKIQCFE